MSAILSVVHNIFLLCLRLLADLPLLCPTCLQLSVYLFFHKVDLVNLLSLLLLAFLFSMRTSHLICVLTPTDV